MPNNQYGTRPDGVDEAEYSHLTPAVGNYGNPEHHALKVVAKHTIKGNS